MTDLLAGFGRSDVRVSPDLRRLPWRAVRPTTAMLAQSHVKDRWILPGDGIAALVVRPRVQLVVIARRGRGGAARSAVLSPDMVRETRPAPARRPGSSPAIDAALALACA